MPRPRLAVLAFVSVLTLQALLLLILLHWQRPADDALARAHGDQYRQRPLRLLVAMPFVAAVIDALELNIALWHHFWPCPQSPSCSAPKPDLSLTFNGNLSASTFAPRRLRRAGAGEAHQDPASHHLHPVTDVTDRSR